LEQEPQKHCLFIGFYYKVYFLIKEKKEAKVRSLLPRRQSSLKRAKFFLFIWLIIFTFSSLLAQENKPITLTSSQELPKRLSRLAEPGDVLLAGPGLKVIFGGNSRPIMTHANYAGGDAKGTIIGIAPPEGEADGQVHVGTPVLRSQSQTRYVNYSEVKFPSKWEQGQAVIQASGAFASADGKKLSVKTTYAVNLNAGRVDITSTITNTGQESWSDLSYSLLFDPFHSYSFTPFHQVYHRSLNFRLYQKRRHGLAWINLNPLPQASTPLPGRLAPGDSFKVNYILLTDAKPSRLLEKIYELLKVTAFPARILLPTEAPGWKEIVVSQVLSGATFFRAIIESSEGAVDFPLPEGVYRVTGHFYPAVVETYLAIEKGRENQARLRLPLMGRLSLRLQDSQGKPVPGKITFIGLQPTRTPYFRPENPVETSRSFETFKNSCFPPPEGLELELPVGTYFVSASRGPEYSLDQRVVEIIADSPQELGFVVDRVVEKPGLISLDPHMHTIFSDGTVDIAARLQSLVAEGVEVAIATDHNIVTDYSPVLKRLGLEKELIVASGTEVTMPDMIHFNVYPLPYKETEQRKGAIEPVAEVVSSLFTASRAKSSQALLQVNHPRAGTLGYFNNYQLDLLSASTVKETFDFGFDILEVMNGAAPLSSNAIAMQDWLHLINRGRFYPLVGSSDSHTIDGGEPGYSRTYVLYDRKEQEAVDLKAVLQAVRQGKSFASTGPLVDLRVNDNFTYGDLVAVKPGPVSFKIKVWAAPWVEVDEVRLIFNGHYRLIFPVKEKSRSVVKMEELVTIQVSEDTAVVAEVIGKKSLYPLLQQPSDSGQLRDAVLPYAVTNPIFIDANGDGQYNPPWPKTIEEVKASTLRGRIISR